ncbi:hypothetical protein [Mycolicibacterium hippocampi]|uniref:Uncharacterized protein n=1 Tax=Mycolicibacterium hippocampi TaxID=659824 RepID=A0A7I9ZR78_9MYCO|nr:hypothetical protein [Mycolicibacterium hippocampi]GFH03273.1 hypothetical protein MHIP_37560 [Mycolicibacterium hippocampi]
MTTGDHDPWGWVGERPPTEYKQIWVSPLSFLTPLPEGAVLRWVYDEDDDITFSLLVRLTEAEAQRVYESPPSSGMLESVRKDLHWRGSLLTLSGDFDEPFPTWRYRIPGDLSEDEFIADLMNPPFEVVRDAILTAQQRRDAKFAAPLLSFALAS